MHEHHAIKPIIKGVSNHARREGAKSVTKLRLKVGQLACHGEESFRSAFATLAKGTMLENAALEITMFPGTVVQVVSFDIE